MTTEQATRVTLGGLKVMSLPDEMFSSAAGTAAVVARAQAGNIAKTNHMLSIGAAAGATKTDLSL